MSLELKMSGHPLLAGSESGQFGNQFSPDCLAHRQTHQHVAFPSRTDDGARAAEGGTLRRHKVYSRHDTEVPIGKLIDWLETRPDVDASRIALCGSSFGGYYAARAGCYEPRLAAVISHGAIWDVHELWGDKSDEFGLAMHIKFVMGCKTMAEAHEKMKTFTLEGHLQHMKCPYFILHGGYDVLTMSAATKAYDSAKANGVDVTLRFLTPEETGAEHCQHDNPTIGQEVMADWLADRFGIDQRALLKTGWNTLL